MIDIPIFLNSIKSNWIKRIINDSNDGLWKEIIKKNINHLGGISLFKCNINTKDILKFKIKNKFIHEVLVAWSEINFNENPKNISEQIIWQNSNIKNNNSLLYFRQWKNKNIYHVKDIYDTNAKKFKTFNQLKTEYNIPNTEFLNYHRLISSIPTCWKRKLDNIILSVTTEEINIYELLEKTETHLLNRKLTQVQKERRLKYQNEKLKSQLKWEAEFPDKNFNWQQIYLNAFDICKDNILQIFYFDFLHRNIATNKFLFRCKLVESSLCDFCNMEIDSIEHIFWTCQQTQIFWNELFKWLVEIGIHATQDKFCPFFIHEIKFYHIFSYLPNIIYIVVKQKRKYQIILCLKEN